MEKHNLTNFDEFVKIRQICKLFDKFVKYSRQNCQNVDTFLEFCQCSHMLTSMSKIDKPFTDLRNVAANPGALRLEPWLREKLQDNLMTLGNWMTAANTASETMPDLKEVAKYTQSVKKLTTLAASQIQQEFRLSNFSRASS